MSSLAINPADPNGRQLIEKRNVKEMERVKSIARFVNQLNTPTPAFTQFVKENPWINEP